MVRRRVGLWVVEIVDLGKRLWATEEMSPVRGGYKWWGLWAASYGMVRETRNSPSRLLVVIDTYHSEVFY
ncbi:unnamed protein product [Dovyalis caffra]|uniref:Uncharacterized protein n=1 Tax=Dovyalis caffra TaxID=77055 RepID=A0AAV1RTZ1_9ROSI|nr:unnamed protein product [Dovyalis caffra]